MTLPSLTATISEVTTGFRNGDFTPLELAEASLAQIRTVEPAINAMAAVDEDRVLADAAASSRRWDSGNPRGSFDGVPITLKDSISSIGRPWRHGLLAHRDLPVRTQDTPPATRLEEAGAVVLGVTTMPDMGMLASGVSSLYGITRNPWNPAFSPGGSSSGAAASLAAGVGYAAVGSDMAGSVRLPAAHCGLVALKPTQGRVPHTPASTMRSAGPMARWVDDVERLYDVISAPDQRDIYGLPAEVETRADISGSHIGVLPDMGYGMGVEAEVLACLNEIASALANQQCDVSEVPAPFDEDPYPVFDRIFAVRAHHELSTLPVGRQGDALEIVRAWSADVGDVDASTYSDDLGRALAVAARFVDRTAAYDYVLSPVLPVVGFPAELPGPIYPPLAHSSFTAIANQTQQPAATVSWRLSESGLPIGVQIIGRKFDDRGVLAIARAVESLRSGWPGWPLSPVMIAS